VNIDQMLAATGDYLLMDSTKPDEDHLFSFDVFGIHSPTPYLLSAMRKHQRRAMLRSFGARFFRP
jgi:hypothetical protein